MTKQKPRKTYTEAFRREAVQLALLCAQVSRGWTRGLSLERSMHALEATVLSWFAGLDEFGHDAQAYPPHGERR